MSLLIEKISRPVVVGAWWLGTFAGAASLRDSSHKMR